MRRRAKLSRGVKLVSAVVLLVSCGRPKTVTPGDPIAVTPSGSQARAPLGVEVAAVATHPLEVLPAQTQAVVMTGNVHQLMTVLQRDALVRRFPAEYTAAVAAITALTGRNLLDPKNLPTIGIDPDGPVGAALLDVRQQLFCGFVTLKNPDALRQTVIDLAKRDNKTVAQTPIGRAVVVQVDGVRNMALVLRDRFAVVVGSDRSDTDVGEQAKAIAATAVATSLAKSSAFGRTTVPGRPIVAYLDVGGIVDAEIRRQENYDAEVRRNWAEEELIKAQREGASAQRLAELEAQAQEQARWQAKSRRRRQAQRSLARRIFDPIQIAFSGQPDRGGISGDVRLPLPRGAYVRGLVRNTEGVSPGLTALDHRPLYAVSGAFDMQGLIELFDDFAKTEDSSWAEASAKMSSGLGIDVNRELFPVLTGGGALAITLDGLPDRRRGIQERLGFSMVIDVRNPAAARRLLDDLARSKSRPFKGLKKSKGGYKFEIAKRVVHVGVAGKHVAISTDPGYARRVASGKRGRGLGSIRPKEAGTMVAARDQLGVVAVDALSTVAFLIGSRSTTSGLSSVSSGAEPRTKAYKAKKRELAAVDKKIDATQAKLSELEVRLAMRVAEPAGITVLHGRMESAGFVGRASWFPRGGGLAEAIEMGVKLDRHDPDVERMRAEVSALWSRRFELQSELQTMRDQVERRKNP